MMKIANLWRAAPKPVALTVTLQDATRDVRRRVLAIAVIILAVGFALLWNVPTAQAQDSQWASHLASNQDVQVSALDVNAAGEVFVAGTYRGTVDFDPGPGEHLLPGGADDVAYIAKYGPGGNLIWAHRIAGDGDVHINDIVVDPMSQIGVTGSFEGEVDLDPGPGVFHAESQGDHDIFLLRLLPDGNLQWAWTEGDEDEDAGIAVATDRDSRLYITGKFEGTIIFQSDEPHVSPPFDHSSMGGSDVFVARFTNAGFLSWVRVLGGDEDDEPTDIALDGNGNIYLTGTFADEVDLDPTWTSFEVRSHGRDDIFLTILDPLGEWWTSMQFGGAGEDGNAQLLVEDNGAFYLSGEFEGSANFNPNGDGGQLESRGQRDIFITRYRPRWQFEWAFNIGGEQTDTLGDIAQDLFGSVYVLGSFVQIIDVEPGEASTLLSSSGGEDIFLAKYTQQGRFSRVQGMSNPQDDRARALAVDPNSNVLIAGEFRGTLDLGDGLSVSTGQPEGAYNVFVTRYARDTWTPLLERVYLPGINAEIPAR